MFDKILNTPSNFENELILFFGTTDITKGHSTERNKAINTEHNTYIYPTIQ